MQYKRMLTNHPTINRQSQKILEQSVKYGKELAKPVIERLYSPRSIGINKSPSGRGNVSLHQNASSSQLSQNSSYLQAKGLNSANMPNKPCSHQSLHRDQNGNGYLLNSHQAYQITTQTAYQEAKKLYLEAGANTKGVCMTTRESNQEVSSPRNSEQEGRASGVRLTTEMRETHSTRSNYYQMAQTQTTLDTQSGSIESETDTQSQRWTFSNHLKEHKNNANQLGARCASKSFKKDVFVFPDTFAEPVANQVIYNYFNQTPSSRNKTITR